MLKTLHFEIDLHAPRARVWDAMLGPTPTKAAKALALLKQLCEEKQG